MFGVYLDLGFPTLAITVVFTCTELYARLREGQDYFGRIEPFDVRV